jgi:hypothetical protein
MRLRHAPPRGLHDHPVRDSNDEHADTVVWWFPQAPRRACLLSPVQGGLRLGLDDFPATRSAARLLLQRFYSAGSGGNNNSRLPRDSAEVKEVVRHLRVLQSHLELVDAPSAADAWGGPLLCALTLGVAARPRRGRHGEQSTTNKQERLKQRRYEQMVQHGNKDLAVYGFFMSICWHLEVPRDDEEDDLYDNDYYGDASSLQSRKRGPSWTSPCILFRPVSSRTTSASPRHPGRPESVTEHSVASVPDNTHNNTSHGRAGEFVARVLTLQNRLHAKTDPAYQRIKVMGGVDDLCLAAQRFMEQQDVFRTDRSTDITVDIGYHYTQHAHVDQIRDEGLLTAADRAGQGIRGVVNNGQTYGDGIYTGDNPFAYHDMHYGKTGVLVARIGGTVKVTEDIDNVMDYNGPLDHDSLRVVRADERVNMSVLRKSAQCLALASFDGDMVNKTEAATSGNRAIAKFHRHLQRILDQFFNDGSPTEVASVEPFRTIVAGTPGAAPFAMVATTTTATTPATTPPRKKASVGTGSVRYRAPESLEGVGFESGIAHSPLTMALVHEPCTLCLLPLGEDQESDVVATLPTCGHVFHDHCLSKSLAFVGSRCPLCRIRLGEPVGKMPSGTLRIGRDEQLTCAGYPPGAIVLHYNIPAGIQKIYHPNPGEVYKATERTAFLPMVPEGYELVRRLKYAFRHGLTLTVGTSLTTGERDVITWTSIHHKTGLTGGVHGFPDGNYFRNCSQELDALGVPSVEEIAQLKAAKSLSRRSRDVVRSAPQS